MEVLFAAPLLLLPFFLPVLNGLMARSFGRKFWPWFFIGLALPLVGCIILLCLPEKPKKLTVPPAPAKRTVFEHEFSGN